MTSKTRGSVLALSACGLMAFCGPASAAAQLLGNHTAWAAWQDTDSTGTICYIAAKPQSMEPGNVDHGDINFLILHRVGMNMRNEVQTVLGYNLDTGAATTATVDGRAYPMTPRANGAWLQSTGDEGPFVDALKRGRTLVVKTRSQRGTNTTYTYSLAGVTAAMADIDKACP